MVDFALSFHDLSLVDGFIEAIQCENKKILDEILYRNGMEVSLGYEITTSTHRTLIGKVFTGNRIEGFERIDKNWIATGAASREAIIESTPDITLRKELREMSRERPNEKIFDNH